MIDIFKLFHVQAKEDIYTYCLKAMLENGGSDFKKRVGEQFGFEEDYQVARDSFTLADSNNSNKQKIIPDLVLYNSHHLSIIESKMFSAEGYSQTIDYSKGAEEIKRQLSAESANAAFFFLTLSGIKAESRNFKPVKWTDFYEAVLNGILFEDETLEVLRKTILSQVRKYRDFEKALVSKPYHDLFNEDIYWVTPLTLFSAGNYDDIWQTISGEERFWVWNGVIQGYGHSEFATDLDKGSWYKENEILGVGVHVFIRIEWNKENPVVWLCWEYYNQKTRKYIPTNKIKSLDIKRQAIESLLKFKEIWKRNESYSHLKIHTTSKKASSIKALKCDISGNQDISEVVKDIKNVMLYYSEEIKSIIDSFIVEDNKLTFNEEKYKV